MKLIQFKNILLLSIVTLLLGFLLAASVSAQVEKRFATGESRMFHDTNVTVETPIENDLFASGEKVNVIADVADNVFIAGGRVVTEGVLGNNAFFGAGELLINGPISGDVFIGAGYTVINGNIEGDLRITTGTLYLNGNISGDALISASEVFIADSVNIGGEETINATSISRNVSNPQTTLDSAEVYNATFMNDFEVSDTAIALFSVLFLLGGTISTLVMGYFVLRVFPVFSEKAISTATNHPLQSVIAAFVTFLVSIVLTFVLLVSVIGIKLLILLSVLATLGFMLGNVYASYISGRFVLKSFGYESSGRFIVLLVGILLVNFGLGLLGTLPYVGPFVYLAQLLISALGFGGIVYAKYSSFTTETSK